MFEGCCRSVWNETYELMTNHAFKIQKAASKPIEKDCFSPTTLQYLQQGVCKMGNNGGMGADKQLKFINHTQTLKVVNLNRRYITMPAPPPAAFSRGVLGCLHTGDFGTYQRDSSPKPASRS